MRVDWGETSSSRLALAESILTEEEEETEYLKSFLFTRGWMWAIVKDGRQLNLKGKGEGGAENEENKDEEQEAAIASFYPYLRPFITPMYYCK